MIQELAASLENAFTAPDADICPFCGGRANTNHWQGEHYNFITMMHPEYVEYMSMATKRRVPEGFSGHFYCCAACRGTGKASIAAGRVLSGEYEHYKHQFYIDGRTP